MSLISRSGLCPCCWARIMMGVPCESSAQTNRQSLPRRRWKRTQMSVWTASIVCPRCSEPLAYGNAWVTRIRRILASVLRGLEFGFADALLVGLGSGDHSLVEELLDRRVHGTHAQSASRLHDGLDLIELALPYQVGRGGRIDEYLQRRHAALAVGPLQQLLGDHPAQRSGQHRAH